jgi:hypothetical protein
LKNEVNSIYPATHDQGISLCQAALVAGLGLLIMTIAAPVSPFFISNRGETS